jgi:threonine/homoserine/homoserine lactone efflux protein
MSIQYESRLLLPLAYGVGTGFPVVLFAVVIAAGAGAVARAFQQVGLFERWARMATGVVFIIVGIYLSLVFVFRVW